MVDSKDEEGVDLDAGEPSWGTPECIKVGYSRMRLTGEPQADTPRDG